MQDFLYTLFKLASLLCEQSENTEEIRELLEEALSYPPVYYKGTITLLKYMWYKILQQEFDLHSIPENIREMFYPHNCDIESRLSFLLTLADIFATHFSLYPLKEEALEEVQLRIPLVKILIITVFLFSMMWYSKYPDVYNEGYRYLTSIGYHLQELIEAIIYVEKKEWEVL